MAQIIVERIKDLKTKEEKCFINNDNVDMKKVIESIRNKRIVSIRSGYLIDGDIVKKNKIKIKITYE